MGKIDRILRAVESQAWAMQPEKVAIIAEVLAAKAEHGVIPSAEDVKAAEEAQAATQRGRVQTKSGNAIAVIPVMGTISRRMGMLDAMSGGTSVAGFMKAFDEAMADEAVGQILLQIHSPGGSVYGIEEAFQKVFSARGVKPVTAVADSLAASAAYYLASAAEQLVVTPSGEVGSIGVYMVHFDWSANMDAEGVKATIIKAGENKAEGNPYEPLSPTAVEHLQSIIQDFYDQFVGAVAKGRGVRRAAVERDFGQGRTFTAQRALARGMVDRVATFEDVLAEMQGTKRRPAMRRAMAIDVEKDIAALLNGEPLPSATGTPDVIRLDAIGDPLGTVTHGTVVDDPYDASASFAPIAETLTDALRAVADLHPSDAAAGQASEADDPAPTHTEPAPEAREDTMSEKDTAAPTAGPSAEQQQAAIEEARAEARAQEQERVRQIRALCSEHKIDAATADRWVNSNFTAEQAKDMALELVQARDAAAPDIRVGSDREAEKPYKILGEQLQDIMAAAKDPTQASKRLKYINERYAAATGQNVSVPSEGGFVLQDTFVPGITTKMWDEGRVLARTNRVPIGDNSNALVRNMFKENSRADGSRYGGVRVYRRAEAATVESSRPTLSQSRIPLEGLMGIYYATEETMQDAVALTAEAERGFRSELTFVAENEVFRGTGAGQCLGILNSDALVSVAAESGQAAATVNATNVAKMMARLPAGSFPTAAWFIHSSVIPQLVLMTIGNQPVFLPGGSVAGAPFGTLFGMPVIPLEYCSAAGTVGDIVLADLQQYTTIDKRGVSWQESVHVRFLYDETAFKLTYRFNGQPEWENKVLEANGSDYISPFVALATRS